MIKLTFQEELNLLNIGESNEIPLVICQGKLLDLELLIPLPEPVIEYDLVFGPIFIYKTNIGR